MLSKRNIGPVILLFFSALTMTYVDGITDYAFGQEPNLVEGARCRNKACDGMPVGESCNEPEDLNGPCSGRGCVQCKSYAAAAHCVSEPHGGDCELQTPPVGRNTANCAHRYRLDCIAHEGSCVCPPWAGPHDENRFIAAMSSASAPTCKSS